MDQSSSTIPTKPAAPGSDSGSQRQGGAWRSFGTLALRVFLILQAVIVVYPLLWNVMSSFKTNAEVMDNPWSLPRGFEWNNYVQAFTTARIGDYMLNSVAVVVMSMAVLLLPAVPSAYAIGRMSFRGVTFFKNFYMAGIFVGGVYIIVPLFIMMNDMNILDNLFWLNSIYATGSLPFSVFLLTGFMKSIPHDYE
ncbi:carbohydrate ABC transporter permease [Paenibacillus sp. CAU 1782]